MYLEHTIQLCMPNSKKKPIKLNTSNKMSTIHQKEWKRKLEMFSLNKSCLMVEKRQRQQDSNRIRQ